MRPDIERTNRAWSSIVDQFLTKAENDAKELGPGVCVFRMLRYPITVACANELRTPNTEHRNDRSNCEYFFIERDCEFWGKVLTGINPQLLSTYDPSTMFMVCVCVPTSDTGDETTQSVRLFEFDTQKEVVLHTA